MSVLARSCKTPRVMRTGLVALVACVAAACHPKAPPPPKPVAANARPFHGMPTITLADNQQPGPLYRVTLGVDIARDVMPTDDLALVVSVGDEEVGRYPIVGRFERRPTRIKQEIELPLGDYEIDLDYQGTRFSGMPFRLADVPVWGGRRATQVRLHPGTRISLREKKLWVGRWWANDGPPQAWIVEWVRDGQVVTATSGREERGIPANAARVVGGAAGAFQSARVVENTIWSFGEEYPVPDVVATQPGAWAARVVHGGASPVAVVFTVLPNGRLAEASSRKIFSVGWQESWSKRLEQRALSVNEVERLTAKLPHVSSTQPFDDVADGSNTIRISTAAVRALFRSKPLADGWWQYESLLAAPPPAAATGATPPTYRPGATRPMDAAGFPKGATQGGAKKSGMPVAREASARTPTPAQAAAAREKEEADRRAKLKALRTQIESLIKTHGGPWKSEEFPRS